MHTISHVTSRTPLAVCVPTDGYRTGAQATASVPQSDRSPLPRSQVLIPEPFAGAACSKPAGIQCRPASPEMVTTVFELLLSAQSLFSSPGCCKPETSLSITSVTAAKQPRASAKHSRQGWCDRRICCISRMLLPNVGTRNHSAAQNGQSQGPRALRGLPEMVL